MHLLVHLGYGQVHSYKLSCDQELQKLGLSQFHLPTYFKAHISHGFSQLRREVGILGHLSSEIEFLGLSAVKGQEVLRFRLHGVNDLAHFFEEESHLLVVALATFDEFDALKDEVGPIFLLLRVELFEHLFDFDFTLGNDLVLGEVEFPNL